jgi:hypothetical protein
MAKWKWQYVALGLLVILVAQATAGNESVEARLRKDITYLASDECEGRGVTTKGINLAADYIVGVFKEAGLKPGGVDGSYFQPFTIKGRARPGSPSTLTLSGPEGQKIELKPGEDFQVMGLSAAGDVKAPVVFAGYGATVPEAGYDDYAGIDVAGKVVVVMRKTPRADAKEKPFPKGDYYAALVTKVANAEKAKVAAILFINDRTFAQDQDKLMKFGDTAFESSHIPAAHIERDFVDRMLKASVDKSLGGIEKDIDGDLKPRSVVLTGWTANLELHVDRTVTPAKNIIGVLEGNGALANETVVVGAHYDHLGHGGPGSLAGNSTAIHHGADDNGSGTTSVLELARRFAARPKSASCRRMVFITFSGEELGLLGSRHYCKHPTIPLESTVAMVNLDMVGRLREDAATNKDKLLVEGAYTSKHFMELLDKWNGKYDFQMKRNKNIPANSDHDSFYQVGVPVLFYWTDLHSDYHRPSDTSDKINIAGMEKVINLAEDTLAYLEQVPERPDFIKSSTPSPAHSGPMGPRLGIRPSYSDDKDGLLLEGVSEGTPAERSGLKGGDRIVEMDSKPIKNINSYMAIMGGHKKGDTIAIVVERGEKRVTIQTKLE